MLLTLYQTRHLVIVRYLQCINVTVWTWDALVSLESEIDVFTDRNLKAVDIIYILSRLFTGLAVFSAFSVAVVPLKDCNDMLRAKCWFGAVAANLSTLLFLLRVKSIFFDSKRAKVVFSTLWGVVSISLFLLPFSYTGTTSQPGGLCVISSLSRLGSIPSLTVGVYDLSVFLSISSRIMALDTAISFKERLVNLSKGRNMGQVLKSLVRTGQLYFFPMVGIEVFILAMEFFAPFEPFVSFQYQEIAMMTGLVIMNAMTCRVFRLLRLDTREDTSSLAVPLSIMRFKEIPNAFDRSATSHNGG
ncbi:hypothetical protein QCA50_011592 [Cerrena zonata]|uniref:G protein-coupled receptor n=1 Tax=Cerrena zonata TaxID=2478898 RepID=A0AAW0G0J6_9APHY